MGRSVAKVVFLSILVVAGWVGLTVYDKFYGKDADLNEERKLRREAEAKVDALKAVVQHLTSEERKADLVVLDQRPDAGGVMRTTLLFQEYGKDGSSLPPKLFTIEGDQAHVDALVIKFQGKYVQDRDPLRGRSIALFTRLFDSKTPAEKGIPIDDPDHIPAIYKGADPRVSEFEQQLWRDFWKLANDRAYREQMGVDVSQGTQGKSVFWQFRPGILYTLSLQADADLNLHQEPLKPIYQEMLRQYQKTVRGPQTAPAS